MSEVSKLMTRTARKKVPKTKTKANTGVMDNFIEVTVLTTQISY